MIFVFLVACALYSIQCIILGEDAFMKEIAPCIIPILMLAVTGIWDDIKEMRAGIKFGLQALAGLASWLLGIPSG